MSRSTPASRGELVGSVQLDRDVIGPRVQLDVPERAQIVQSGTGEWRERQDPHANGECILPPMARLLKRFSTLLAVLIIAFGLLIGALALTTPDPRPAQAWRRLADMPSPRGETSAAVGARVDDDCDPTAENCADPLRIVVAGGLLGAGKAVATVSMYDPGSDRWSAGPDLPAARHHVGAAGLGGVVYVSGGSAKATNWAPEDNFWALLPNERGWMGQPRMPEGRMGHQMVAIDQKLYVVGGRGETSNVLIFDTVAHTWSTGAQMPAPRDHLAVVVSDEQIWAIGGRGDDLLDRVDIYDPKTDAWTTGPKLPRPMSAMAAGVLPDGIHVVGGEDPAVVTGGVIDKHYVYAGERWTEAPLPIVPTHGSAAVVFSDKLFVAGGARRQSAFSPIGWTGVTEMYPKG
jgi:hypothetical protein